MQFWTCIIYIAITGVAAFAVGRLLPKSWFRFDAFPYRPFRFENNGLFYERLSIKSWQARVPDMSKLFSKLMPKKQITADYKKRLPRMVQETCVAECVHFWLSLSGLYCLFLWPGAGGVIFTAVYILLGNLPFILIQRYNRPRLVGLMHRCGQAAAPDELQTTQRRTICEHSY